MRTRLQASRSMPVLLFSAIVVLVCVAVLVVLLTNFKQQAPAQGALPAGTVVPTSLPIGITPGPIPTLPTHNLPTVALTPPPDMPSWTPGEPDTESMMSFKPADPSLIPPKVSKRQAIAIANADGYSGPWVTARYVLMTHEPAEAYINSLKLVGLAKLHPDGFKDVPVWIVSYEGVRDYQAGNNQTPLPPHREINVIVSAENGMILGGYSFR